MTNASLLTGVVSLVLTLDFACEPGKNRMSIILYTKLETSIDVIITVIDVLCYHPRR